ncbi:unnamed protein product [Lepeophtheirus salmonis]|uniref:(salmon louse) hypothetical protein n=1 Tax=Lepeophtheirus salmonis TaxID=72036 RepID=A0A817FE31_LEPSM|nr:unnamed protein product [Lepeophtheirus salmonis]
MTSRTGKLIQLWAAVEPPNVPTASSRTWNAEEQATLAKASLDAEAECMLILQAVVNTPLTNTQIISEFESQATCQKPTTLSPNVKILGEKEYTERPPISLISNLSDLMIQKPGPMYNDLLEVIVESHIKSHETQTTVSTPRPVTSSSATRAAFAKCLNHDFPKGAQSLLQGKINSLAAAKKMTDDYAPSWKAYFEGPSQPDE